MKIKGYLLLLLLLSGAFLNSCNSPKPEGTRWYKGNLHTHTFWSDGDEFPEMVLDWYKSNGYDFVALSDHNTVANDEKWKVISKSPMYEKSFQQYLDKFGKDWVVYKTDTGRVQVKLKTYAEYSSKMADAGFLVIPSEEITNLVADTIPVHINATNLQEFIQAPNAATVAETMQQSVDAVLQQRQRTGVPMFPHINHPNFYWAITLEDMISLKGELFFEVYNGHPRVRNYGDSVHIGMEEMWDKINIAYANRNQPLMFGLATDDTHNYHEFGTAFSNAGRGWVMVQAEKLDASTLISAMEAGDFYASTGVEFKTLLLENNEIRIEIDVEKDITYNIEFIGAKKGDNGSKVIESVKGGSATFKITDEFLFVRARVTSNKQKYNPFEEGDFEMAWTQPVATN